jgi:uncharacterized membrane protein YjfL (UPF0719 family)
MNEIFDKLIIRITITLVLSLMLYLFKYAHAIFYPSAKLQVFRNFYPARNSADTLHLFSRIIGIGIIFSGIYFNITQGFGLALIKFIIHAITALTLYLLSIYTLESIIFFNFEYGDEVIRKKNISYAIISFSSSISLAIIVKAVVTDSNNSLLVLFFMWLLAMVLYGFTTKFYRFVSRLSFNKLIIHKNLAIAFSYSGHLLGSAFLIVSAFDHKLVTIENYTLQVLIKVILAALILPLFHKALILIFNIRLEGDFKGNENENTHEFIGPPMGQGVYEGTLFFTSSFLTSVIINHILFGNFYPMM